MSNSPAEYVQQLQAERAVLRRELIIARADLDDAYVTVAHVSMQRNQAIADVGQLVEELEQTKQLLRDANQAFASYRDAVVEAIARGDGVVIIQ
jgi:hypothetical protein